MCVCVSVCVCVCVCGLELFVTYLGTGVQKMSGETGWVGIVNILGYSNENVLHHSTHT